MSHHDADHDAEQARDDLSQTLDELAHRLDVPARTRAKLSDLRESRSGPIVACGAVAAVCLLLVMWRRKSRRSPSRPGC